MSTPKPTNAIVVAVVVCFVTVVTACTVVFVVAGEDAAGFITPILGFAGVAIATLAAFANVDRKVSNLGAEMSGLGTQVAYLTNGGLDSKIRAALPEVISDEFIKQDDETQNMLAADRAHREAGPVGS